MSFTKNLLESLKNDNLENALECLEAGADPNYVFPTEGVAPIHLAAGLGRKALSLFIEYGGDPNVRSREGSTPLHVAATWGDDDCIKLLLQCGADPHIKDQDGYEPVDVAKVYGHKEVYIYLKYYALLLLSDSPDIIEKYTRESITEDSKILSDDNITVDDSYDSDEASQLFDECMTAKHYDSLYTNVVSRQLHHHMKSGNPVSFDVTSPDHPYMDVKHNYRQHVCQSPVSGTRSKPLNNTFVLTGSSEVNNNNSRIDSSSYQTIHTNIDYPVENNKFIQQTDQPYVNHGGTYPPSKNTIDRSNNESPLPEFQKNFKQNNTLQWVSEHAGLYNKHNHSLQEKKHCQPPAYGCDYSHSSYNLPKYHSDDCQIAHPCPHTIPMYPCSHQICHSCHVHHTSAHHHDSCRPSCSNISQSNPYQVKIQPSSLPKALEERHQSDSETTESDSTLSKSLQKSSQYSKRQFIKSNDNHILPRRCRDDRNHLNKLSRIGDTHGAYLEDPNNFPLEACIGSDSSQEASVHMISDCVPILSESRDISTVSDIVAQNRVAYQKRVLENKAKWAKQQNSSVSEKTEVTSFNSVIPENVNLNNSLISINSDLGNILNTAQLSNTLPFDMNSSRSSTIPNTYMRRGSDSSCDTFVTCEDGDPNKTISDEQINVQHCSAAKTAETCSSPIDCSLDESKLFTSDESFIERKAVRQKKILNNNNQNVRDLSDRLKSFKIHNPGGSFKTSLRKKSKDEKEEQQAKNYSDSDNPISEPSLISVSTPNDKNVSPADSRKLSNVSSVLNNGFCGDRRPSLDSMFSTISVKEYVYRDAERGITLIERHVPSECGNSIGRLSLDSVTSARSIDSQKTEEYDWKTYIKNRSSQQDETETDESDVETVKLSQELSSLSNQEIRSHLLSYGEDPGPVIPATRQTYLMRLCSIRSNPGLVQITKNGPDYSVDLRNAMKGKFDDTDLEDLEVKMMNLFNNSNGRKWREGALKSSFNYLLLDPRVTKNLPLRAKNMTDSDIFCTFVAAIFYIGKGKRSRPYTHLYEAITHLQKPKSTVSSKVQQILDIWSEQQGVISLHIFQNVIPVEAYTREACMIQAFGLDKLTNKKKGDFYGTSSTWSMKVKRRMGVYFLRKALQIFLAEGERQICPPDIKMGQ